MGDPRTSSLGADLVEESPAKQEKMDELEAKNNLLVKANKFKNELDKQKGENRTILDKLNAALLFNEKLEEYVSHLGDVLNKARLFITTWQQTLSQQPR